MAESISKRVGLRNWNQLHYFWKMELSGQWIGLAVLFLGDITEGGFIMLRKIQNAFNRTGQKTVESQDEYIQYAQEVECTLRFLESQLHDSDDAEEIIQNVMKTACEFYQGDWVGFLQVDLELGLWTPYVWYNPNENDQTAILLQEFESSEFFSRWIDALHQNSALYFHSLMELVDTSPHELELYKHLNVRCLLAVPIKPRPTGFLVVRNPQRYITRSSMLQMLAYVLLSSINEQKLMQSMRMSFSPENIKKDTDVIIHLFGNLEIYTSSGVLRESDLKSPKICRLLAYMLLSRKVTIPPRELAEVLWPDEVMENDNPSKNLRALIFRLRQSFSLISPYRLIETTATGYCFNPELNIMTDLQAFEKYWQAAQQSQFVSDKVDILKKALDLYKGNVLESAADEHWLIPTASHYSLRYAGMVNELLKTLAEEKDFHNLHKYAAQALALDPGNGAAYYWLIYAMLKMGATELAKTQVQIAEANLTEEDFHTLIEELKKAEIAPMLDLFRNEKIKR